MTVLNTGSNNRFSANWEGIFAKGKSKKKPAPIAKKSATRKKAAAKKK